MNKRPVDKTKKSNRRCGNCKYYEWCNERELSICTYNKKLAKYVSKDYWKVCSNFEWREVKDE